MIFGSWTVLTQKVQHQALNDSTDYPRRLEDFSTGPGSSPLLYFSPLAHTWFLSQILRRSLLTYLLVPGTFHLAILRLTACYPSLEVSDGWRKEPGALSNRTSTQSCSKGTGKILILSSLLRRTIAPIALLGRLLEDSSFLVHRRTTVHNLAKNYKWMIWWVRFILMSLPLVEVK